MKDLHLFHQPDACFIEKTWSKHQYFFHLPPTTPLGSQFKKKLAKSIPRMSYNSSQPAGCCSIRILLGGQFQSMAASFKECCQMFPKLDGFEHDFLWLCGYWIFRLLVIRLASFDEAVNVPMTTATSIQGSRRYTLEGSI